MAELANHKYEVFAQAIAAGMSHQAACDKIGMVYQRANVARMCKKKDIAARILELQRASAKRVGITKDEIMQELAFVAFSKPDEPPKWSDKNKALELLGKHFGMFAQDEEKRGRTLEELIIASYELARERDRKRALEAQKTIEGS